MSARRVISLLGSVVRDRAALRLRSAAQPHFSRHCISTSAPLRFSEPAPVSSRSDEFENLINTMRRPQTRKRRPLTANLAQKSREPSVVSIAVAESFNLHGVANDSALNSLFNVNFIDEEFDDALYLVKKSEYNVKQNELNELFIFEDGVVVFWNVEANQRSNILRELERFTASPYDSRISMDEQDRMPFTTIDGDSCIKSDRFYLNSTKHAESRGKSSSILERYAFSQGFAASVKIGVWESLLNELSEPLSSSTKSLKEGKIPWSRKETLVKSGEFAALRHSINLDCDLLNRDFYWNREDIERFYEMSARHFTLNRRMGALNSRLDYCEELVKMVDNMLALRHASTLEWMIIVLIVIEVFFDVFHFADSAPKKVIVVAEESS